MTQFKEKAGKDRENASVGLFNYPVLMAADILRLSRDPRAGRRRPEAAPGALPATSRRSSTTISPRASPRTATSDGFFPLPEPLIQGPATRVMSLRDGTKKMSKSDPSEFSLYRHHRRRRHGGAEDPQGQDRPRAAAERGRRVSPAARRPTISSASSPASTIRPRPTCCGSSAARSSPPSSRR